MIYKATRVIHEALLAENIKCEINEPGSSSVVAATFKMKAGNSVTVNFISVNDENDVAVRVFNLIHADENKRAAVMAAVNQINCQFRYAKFTLEPDGNVYVQADIPQKTAADLGPIAVELLVRIINIIDDSYPTLMKALWA